MDCAEKRKKYHPETASHKIGTIAFENLEIELELHQHTHNKLIS